MLPAPPQSTQSVNGAILTIDLDAVAINYEYFRRTVGPAETSAVVKADAYGIGAVMAARRLVRDGCKTFFVAHPLEGAEIRPHLPADAIIYVLHGFTAAEARSFSASNLRPVLSSLEQIKAYRASGLSAPCALHFDTGMARLGIPKAETGKDAFSGLDIALVMSHLACGDDPKHPFNVKQRQDFAAIRAHFPGAKASLAASGGALLGPEFAFDLVRPGIGLYGGKPHDGAENPMQPVATLTAPVIQIRTIDYGQSVGYGATYVASAARTLATVGIGYADGLLRALSNRGAGVIEGVRCSFAGRVSMDLVTLDVSECPPGSVQPGTQAAFICRELPVDEVAKNAGTAAYEVLTRLGPRIGRRYLGA
jgi:alanine racemase